ncbi:hypothetical protein PHYPSEUDO_005946 [Phytophthora pseudosyringae]|uniref:HTH CENPB-type domain-containing protein n=1 Tax=Phytophthora pseudosyringae TaxID=221518 RepID=A0A8T1VMV0_9STRA|nr:hypothetical protein PHYPSEUDO_005946 [Phytophthora pseudosyringae]
MQRAGLCVRRRDVLNKANELKGSEAAECSTQWFQRFRERHPEVSGSGTNLVLSETTTQLVLGVQDSDESVAEDPSAESGGQQEEAEEKVDQVQLTPSQRAVQVLQTCYVQQLDAEEMVDAFDLMADPVLARVFLVIAPGQLREMWLKQRIQKVRGAENDADAAAS